MSPGGVTWPQWTNTMWHGQMDAMLQMTFSKIFSCMKMFVFWFKFHWYLIRMFQSIIIEHWFRLWFGTESVTNHLLGKGWINLLPCLIVVRNKIISLYLLMTEFTIKKTQAVETLPIRKQRSAPLHYQYHGCCWHDDAKGQGINSHAIGLVLPGYVGLSTSKVSCN